MLKVIGILFGVIVLCVVVVLVIATTKPSTFSVERSTDIAATPDAIAPLTTDFHNWKQWSPWEHLDPNMTTTYSGPASGPGAKYDWQGNSKVGKGHMEVLSASPIETHVRVVFLSPFPGDNLSTFTFTPAGSTTRVTWAMAGPVFFPAKIMSVFVSMDKMIGPDFDRGLASMKQAAEKH